MSEARPTPCPSHIRQRVRATSEPHPSCIRAASEPHPSHIRILSEVMGQERFLATRTRVQKRELQYQKPETVTLPALQKTFLDFFVRTCLGILHWKWRGFLVIFFWSPSPTKRTTKTPQKNRGKFGAKFGAKLGTKIRKIRGTFFLQLVSPKKVGTFSRPLTQKRPFPLDFYWCLNNSHWIENCICICVTNEWIQNQILYLFYGANQNTTCRGAPTTKDLIRKEFPICTWVCIY